MKSKAVWIAGAASLAVLAAVGLHFTLPGVEDGVRAQVDRVMTGHDDVKATVSGQTVTLTAMDGDPDAASKLAQAKAAVASIKSPDEPTVPGGQWLNGTVTGVNVVSPQAPTVAAKLAATAASAATDAPPTVGGEKATSIDTSVSITPPVAGDDGLPLSRVAAQACEEKIYKAMNGRKVSYAPGSYDLTADSQPVLDDVAKTMAGCPANLRLTVVGYTDNAGDAMASRLISKARAQTAADGLVKRGLASRRISADGEGQASPIADNSTPEGRAANERIAFEVSQKD